MAHFDHRGKSARHLEGIYPRLEEGTAALFPTKGLQILRDQPVHSATPVMKPQAAGENSGKLVAKNGQTFVETLRGVRLIGPELSADL